MNPYLTAHAAYVAEDRDVDWTTALDVHFQRGVVISLPDVFLLARPVDWLAEDADHLSLDHWMPGSDAWHVWAAAGSVPRLLQIAREQGAHQVSFQRRDEGRLRRYHLFNR